MRVARQRNRSILSGRGEHEDPVPEFEGKENLYIIKTRLTKTFLEVFHNLFFAIIC